MLTYSISATRSAIIYQSLYLINLLLLPGFAFFTLLWFWFSKRNLAVKLTKFSRIHLIRAIQLSVVSGVFLIIIPMIIMVISIDVNSSLMVMIIYFVTFHTGLVLIGLLNLSRAMAKKLPLF
ncbi:MAG: hypothetical protein COB83_04840 [Gammaproteobacteria bacterium]|nr:MAG: hypothetical protein COB83_04840 [Gammaproteobacteria bacterium]